jgi:hypothetical protein
MVLLVFVRSMVDLPSAMNSLDAFLHFRRSRNGRARDEEISGVWVSPDLGRGFPGRNLGDEDGREDSMVARPSNAGAEAGLRMRESCELSGVWACGWLDGPLISDASSPAERRDAVVRVLTDTRPLLGGPRARGVFLPIFGPDAPFASLDAEVAILRARYPQAIGSAWFRRDRTRGFVAGSPISSGAQHRRDLSRPEPIGGH